MNKNISRQMKRFAGKAGNFIGLALVIVYIGVAVGAPWLAPTPAGQKPTDLVIVGLAGDVVPRRPSAQTLLGTLPGQIDIYHALIWGTQSALIFGVVVALCSAAFGLFLGAAGGFWGGRANTVILRITDAFLAVPLIAGAYFCKQLVLFAMRNAGIWIFPNGDIDAPGVAPGLVAFFLWLNPILIAFILFSWMPYVRLTNSLVLRLRQADFIQAARAQGASAVYIILHHLIPNVITPAITFAARDISVVVMLQATFQYIGLDTSPGWGQILGRARNFLIAPGGDIFKYWWLYLPATLLILVFSVSWNLLGDGLNDWLNPRQNKQSY